MNLQDLNHIHKENPSQLKYEVNDWSLSDNSHWVLRVTVCGYITMECWYIYIYKIGEQILI